MLVCDYIVERIDGDYAMLKRTNLPEEEEKMVARALLPEEIREGSRLHYELLQYTISKCNFLFRNFSENIKGNGCAYLIKRE